LYATLLHDIKILFNLSV